MHDIKHTAQSASCTSLIHASCASWHGQGVLLTGKPGSGKSSLLLRLVDSGFLLVGDDQLILEMGSVRPAPPLAGLVEIRGLGIVKMPYQRSASIALHVHLIPGHVATRLPTRKTHEPTGAWSLTLDGFHSDTPALIRTALQCINGPFTVLCGINGATTACHPLPIDHEQG